MILGTSSHVGKSTLTAALGRILSDDGLRVAPFKAQNMSLNSAATPDGCEIGRAQALQAEACRTVPRAEMNPVLIKPSTHTSSQVVVLGRVWGQVDATAYYRRRVEELFPIVIESYRKLASEHDVILLEGAGSPAEINLKSRDIVNMRMAMAAEAPCLLVGDIDRGGVFAALLGTLELLDPQERAHIRAFVINKFRGDLSLLLPGIREIEARLGIPCAGVIPFLDSLGLEEEDSVALENRPAAKSWPLDGTQLRVGVIALPHLSNFTDFDALSAEPSVSVGFLERPEQLAHAHVIIIPGSKQTIDDLQWLRRTGLADAVLQSRDTVMVIGICGGMQMLGRSIEDVTGIESGRPMRVSGLGLLPVHTTLRAEKVTYPASGTVIAPPLTGMQVSGYEIHLGETEYLPGAQPFARIRRGTSGDEICDGAVDPGASVFGTYLHGLFDADDFRHAFLRLARRHADLSEAFNGASVQAERDGRINRLAAHIRTALNMELIYSFLR
jgi:adenosylcobyric acid synthase